MWARGRGPGLTSAAGVAGCPVPEPPSFLLVAGGLWLLPVPRSSVLPAEPLPPTAHLLWCHHLSAFRGHRPAGPEGGTAVQPRVSVLGGRGQAWATPAQTSPCPRLPQLWLPEPSLVASQLVAVVMLAKNWVHGAWLWLAFLILSFPRNFWAMGPLFIPIT